MPLITLTLEVIRLAVDPDYLVEARCSSCHVLITVDQPDVELRERLLGVCPECRAWFLIDVTSGIMIRLPHQDTLRGVEPSSPHDASFIVHPGR